MIVLLLYYRRTGRLEVPIYRIDIILYCVQCNNNRTKPSEQWRLTTKRTIVVVVEEEEEKKKKKPQPPRGPQDSQ